MTDTEPQAWQVWRRPRNTRQRWEKVPGLEPMGYDAAFRATMAEERKASFTDWEYALSPVGQTPKERPYASSRRTFYEGYQTKVMKPHGN